MHKHVLFVIGDLNAHIYKDDAHYSFHERTNSNRKLLLDFCMEEDLNWATWFDELNSCVEEPDEKSRHGENLYICTKTGQKRNIKSKQERLNIWYRTHRNER